MPFSPNVIVGYSAGTFGGGSNLAAAGLAGARPSRGSTTSARATDFDAVVYWTAQNLGVGNLAMIRLAQSNVRTNNLRQLEVLDRVRTEVATAYARTHARFAQIETSERAVRTGAKAFQEDLVRAKNKEAHPIEVLDSLRLLRTSRYDLPRRDFRLQPRPVRPLRGRRPAARRHLGPAGPRRHRSPSGAAGEANDER